MASSGIKLMTSLDDITSQFEATLKQSSILEGKVSRQLVAGQVGRVAVSGHPRLSVVQARAWGEIRPGQKCLVGQDSAGNWHALPAGAGTQLVRRQLVSYRHVLPSQANPVGKLKIFFWRLVDVGTKVEFWIGGDSPAPRMIYACEIPEYSAMRGLSNSDARDNRIGGNFVCLGDPQVDYNCIEHVVYSLDSPFSRFNPFTVARDQSQIGGHFTALGPGRDDWTGVIAFQSSTTLDLQIHWISPGFIKVEDIQSQLPMGEWRFSPHKLIGFGGGYAMEVSPGGRFNQEIVLNQNLFLDRLGNIELYLPTLQRVGNPDYSYTRSIVSDLDYIDVYDFYPTEPYACLSSPTGEDVTYTHVSSDQRTDFPPEYYQGLFPEVLDASRISSNQIFEVKRNNSVVDSFNYSTVERRQIIESGFSFTGDSGIVYFHPTDAINVRTETTTLNGTVILRVQDINANFLGQSVRNLSVDYSLTGYPNLPDAMQRALRLVCAPYHCNLVDGKIYEVSPQKELLFSKTQFDFSASPFFLDAPESINVLIKTPVSIEKIDELVFPIPVDLIEHHWQVVCYQYHP